MRLNHAALITPAYALLFQCHPNFCGENKIRHEVLVTNASRGLEKDQGRAYKVLATLTDLLYENS